MGTRDPRVDAYIGKSADFAKPILAHIRSVVHEACPDAIETMKWGVPHFDYEGIMCGMAAFKQHCAFGFWKASLIAGSDARSGDAMGQFGRIQKIADLPPKTTLKRYVRKAMELNESGVKVERLRKHPPNEISVPADLQAALRKNRKALATFEGFSPSHRREYLSWITEAKSDDTRKRRLEQAIAWMAEGKPRHWKYVPKPRAARTSARA